MRAKRFVCYSQGQGHSKATVSTISAELLSLFVTKLGLMVHDHKAECFVEKLYCCSQGHSTLNVENCSDIS